MAQEYAFDHNTLYSLEEIQAVDPAATVENDDDGSVVWAIKGSTEYVFCPDGEGWTLDHTWHKFVLIRQQGGGEEK